MVSELITWILLTNGAKNGRITTPPMESVPKSETTSEMEPIRMSGMAAIRPSWTAAIAGRLANLLSGSASAVTLSIAASSGDRLVSSDIRVPFPPMESLLKIGCDRL